MESKSGLVPAPLEFTFLVGDTERKRVTGNRVSGGVRCRDEQSGKVRQKRWSLGALRSVGKGVNKQTKA